MKMKRIQFVSDSYLLAITYNENNVDLLLQLIAFRMRKIQMSVLLVPYNDAIILNVFGMNDSKQGNAKCYAFCKMLMTLIKRLVRDLIAFS